MEQGRAVATGWAEPGSAPQPAERPRRSVRRKLTFTGAILLLMLIGAEGGLRVAYRVSRGTWTFAPTLDIGRNMYRAHPSCNYELVPGYEMRVPGRLDIAIGESGFRQAPPTIHKPPGTVRIACLGGSTTFCTYATHADRTWPAQLGIKLHDRHPHVNFEIINAAVAGYTTAESLPTFALRVLEYEPDVVLVHHANNDAKPVSFDREFRSDYTHWRHASRKSGDEPWWQATAIWRSLRFVQSRLRQSARLTGTAEAPSARGVAAFARNLESIITLARQNGAEPVLLTMASMLPAEDTPVDQADKTWTRQSALRERYTEAGVLIAMKTMNQAIRDTAARNGVVAVDMVRLYPKNPDYFTDGLHKNDAGLEAFAEILADQLERAGVIDRACQKLNGAAPAADSTGPLQ